MEFGIFIMAYNPAFRREGNPNAEHEALMYDIECAKAADAAGFKYVWITEHHFLDEYSHLSANDVVAGYLAHATERIHIGSGIFNPLPQVNHPAKVAERVAMLDHLSGGRFEFGTGRGAGTHEILGFLPGMRDLNHTREIWEDVIGEFPKMWLQDEYEGYQGQYWSLPPRKILPKPYGPGHPAMWYAAGNTTSWEMAGRRGLGVLGFSIGSLTELTAVCATYKNAVRNADPIGAYVNDNIMVCINAYVDEDRRRARQSYVDSRPNYLVSNVFRYHDTFPHPEGVPYWPETLPDATLDEIDYLVEGGAVIGDPSEALVTCERWAEAGCDQLVFGVGAASLDDTLESIRLLGEHVIPKLDTDPVHSTTRFRATAR